VTANMPTREPWSRSVAESTIRSTASPAPVALPSSFVRDAAASAGVTDTGNFVIKGENLGVLEELSPNYEGAVRCIYIDPPYNNQERYRHYDDVSSHEEWLKAIGARLQALKPLMTKDGSIWISIDDRELHYLKVAADHIFGRQNFVSTIVWQQRMTRENRRAFSNNHEYVLVYAADSELFRRTRHPVPASDAVLARYKNPDGDHRGLWQSVSANVQDGHATTSQHYELVAPNGRRHRPPEGRCWVYTAERMATEIAEGRVWFGKDGNGVPRLKRFLNGSHGGLTPETLWLAQYAGTNDEAKKHVLSLFPTEPVFDTPKPERLIARILEIATQPGDLVLDIYLGSGTTSAVAHKLNRRHLGIEQNEDACLLAANRLRAVVAGERGGISSEVGWGGGGGFDFYRHV
jgi:adenine-specific DNA-methyltransferase